MPLYGVPELPEVERYRKLAEAVVGRCISLVRAPDGWYLKGGISEQGLRRALRGRRITAARRVGKLLLLDTSAREGLGGHGPTLGLRFGMTGRLHVDGTAGVDELIYSSNADRPGWVRLALGFEEGGELHITDPRRLGSVTLDPPEARLGPDASKLSAAQLRAALAGSSAPLKARLLDQAKVAGIGNLLADEILWRAGISPLRRAGTISGEEVDELARAVRRTVSELSRRGGSHTGDLMEHRRPGGRCPEDGQALVRDTVGGRTTWWCPRHQI